MFSMQRMEHLKVPLEVFLLGHITNSANSFGSKINEATF
jgi:hypothetical protein